MFEAIATKLAEIGFASVAQHLSKKFPATSPLRVGKEAVEQALAQHLRELHRWANETTVSELTAPKQLSRMYVDLDLNLQPARIRGNAQPDRSMRVSELLIPDENFVLLGDPGAGKTTSLKKIASELLLARTSDAPDDRTPVLVRLRSLRANEHLIDALLAIVGLRLEFRDIPPQRRRREKLEVLNQFLARIRAWILLDGLDEMTPSAIDGVVEEVKDLLYGSEEFRLILTCRSGAFIYALPNTRVLEISPLSPQQVREFAEAWLGVEKAKRLVNQIRKNPYTGAEIRPLTLAHLCAIFERTDGVPEKPRSVYHLIVRLYIQDWDMQRSVRRVSRYGGFELDRKEEFLEALAFALTQAGARGIFYHSQLEEAYLSICRHFGLPERDASRVAREIESHTGLIVEAGREMYEFAHKSVQEYLCAQYIVRSPRLPSYGMLRSIPSELAIAVVVSSRPPLYFASAVGRLIPEDGLFSEDFTAFEYASSFLSRLVLERADFYEVVEFAVALVTFLAHVYHHRPAQYNEPQRAGFEQLIRSVFRLHGVAESLRALQSYATIQKTPAGECAIDLDLFFLQRKEPMAFRLLTRIRSPRELILPLRPFEELGLLTRSRG